MNRIVILAMIIGTTVYCQRPSALRDGKFLQMNGHTMLYGGEREEQHFNINNLDLNPAQFHYGLGRERFPALLEPEFYSVEQADVFWSDQDRFLVAQKGGDIKAYAVRDLTRHEVVNDVLDGTPIFAAYCILADLGAIYKRTYEDKTFTFAVSGYTYYDPEIWQGMDGFILWDRETESLWWPLIDKAVSGPLKGVPLKKLEAIYWEDTNWKTIKARYPKAQVLISGQDYERPKQWKRYLDVSNITEKYPD